MNILKQIGKYRVISITDNSDEYAYCYVMNYKVQVKVLFFWITIKEFKETEYDDSDEFCRNEAIELFNKIVNPYGKI